MTHTELKRRDSEKRVLENNFPELIKMAKFTARRIDRITKPCLVLL